MRTGDLYKEKELLALIAKSDEAAFAELFDHYRNRIYSSARKLSRSAVIAEEIVQNVFLKIWLNRADLTGVNNFSAYLFVITRNEVYLALNRIARSYKIHSLFSKEQPPSDNDNERRFMDREYQNLLQKAIERLPVQQKKVYQLMKVQGLKREEAASLLRVHPETVKSHLAQAVKSVRSYCLLHLHLLYGLVFCFSFLS
ncbi:MAG: sigma-70 family RNA polymerase sigma factor [Sphingobacteriales bacterium]|nr:sigma-70 family RNA polymerase sigma factor [Sphingobacteriales bacterium]OJY87436.1 MAG: hypothetical protein BGP14_08845 [Sphingobacteriales bacterium 44-15]